MRLPLAAVLSGLLALSGCGERVDLDPPAGPDAVAAAEREVELRPGAAAYYNLALAYRGIGDLGRATWAVESSLALGGVAEAGRLRDELRRDVPADLRPLSESGAVAAWRSAATGAPPNAWAGLALAFGLCGGLVAGWGAVRGRGARSGGLVPLVAGLWLVATASASLAFARVGLREAPTVVVVTPTSLYAAPSERSEVLREIPAGVVLDAGESLGGTYAVELPTGTSGWIPAAAVRRVLSKD